jgi:YhcH/YjgK/YiaL family protein
MWLFRYRKFKIIKVNRMKLIIALLTLMTSFTLNQMDNTGLNENKDTPSDTTWTKQKASKWFSSRKWLNGVKLQPHQTIDQQEFARQYHANKSYWDKAFAYLKETDLNTAKPGKYPIDGENVYATITEASTKELDSSKFEAHQKYVDIQYVIKGKELIGVSPLSTLTVVQAYDPSKDIGFHMGEGKYYEAQPGTFFIFFPKNAHRPGLKVKDLNVVKKLVIKVSTGSVR